MKYTNTSCLITYFFNSCRVTSRENEKSISKNNYAATNERGSVHKASTEQTTINVFIVNSNGCIELTVGEKDRGLGLDVGHNLIEWAFGRDTGAGERCEEALQSVLADSNDQEIFIRMEDKTLSCCEFRRAKGFGPSKALVSLYNVSAHRTDRRRLARALKAANMVWWEWDLESDKFTLHAEGDCILGYDCATETFTPKFWMDRVHPDDQKGVRDWLATMRKGKSDVTTSQHRYKRADTRTEKWEWVEEIACVISRRPDGSPDFVEGTTRNIHQRKLMEASIWLSKSYAEKAHRSREEFLTTVSHEMRTPLNAISGAAQIIAAEQGASKNREFIDMMEASVGDLCEILDRLVDYSRVITETRGGKESWLGLNQIIEELLPLIENEREKANIQISVEIPDPDPILMVEEEKMVYALSAIVGNAIRFSEPGGEVRIRARQFEESKEKGHLQIHIEDDGVGMDEDTRVHAFQPFYESGNRVRNRKGMGLAVSREFVNALGGDIEIESAPNKGTRVTIYLPLD